MSATYYCHGEAEEFPEDQFFLDDLGRRVHKVGRRKDWHYLNGDPYPRTTSAATNRGTLAIPSMPTKRASRPTSSKGRKI